MKNRGFTLIEVIIYIALFSLMIGSLVVTAFHLLQNSGKTNARTVAQEEMNFVLKKIDWVFTGVESVENPTSGSGNTLEITKAGNTLSIRLNTTDNKIELCVDDPCTDDADFFPITTVNVHIDDLNFTYLPAVGSSPEGIMTTVTIDGQTATSSKYLRI